MNSKKIKKAIVLNLPYFLTALIATKLSAAWQLAPGMGFAEKTAGFIQGLALSFQSPLPSFQPTDLAAGCLMGLLLRLAVHVKGRNARKFRKNMEYGSARWGTAEDIAPYIDPTFENNILLTQTERLTMNSRPKDPNGTVFCLVANHDFPPYCHCAL